jgi:hypothetical protein
MFDKEENQLTFSFKRTEKVDVTFNLISALQSLDLIVENGNSIPDDDEAAISTDGFLVFKADDAPESMFTIMVRKREAFDKKDVHFTLIASTKGKQIRL